MIATNSLDNHLQHLHCQSCVKIIKCMKKGNESCAIIECPKKCGARFHTCKLTEHSLLCSDVKEPCINAIYGCPHVLKRSDRGSHLQSCPASVLPCTAEWNRWPLCTKERHVPFAQINPQLKPEHLDVALALRDQENLNHWMSLPRKIHKLMRCTLTPRHPAIPLVRSLWDPPFKRKLKSISSEDGLLSAESTPRQSAERSDTSMLSTISTDEESPWGRRQKPPGLLQSVCAQLFNKKAGQIVPIVSIPQPVEENPVSVEDDTISDISEDLDRSDELGAPEDAVFELPAVDVVPPALPLLTTLGIDLSIECVPRYMNKPKSMYTFVCAQNFRRDEYAWHYRNWHSEIHGGLDGWMEQRCPLARYGCSYARRRMHPSVDSRIIYSSTVHSFGVVPLESDTEKVFGMDENALLLSDLPFELLRTIAGYLDSFSLCHLALTSRLFRDVARSLLHHRGLVNPYWQKTRQGWQITHYRWSFSTAFNPVERWVFDGADHMSNHVKNCRYYVKSDYVYPERIFLPGCDPEATSISH